MIRMLLFKMPLQCTSVDTLNKNKNIYCNCATHTALMPRHREAGPLGFRGLQCLRANFRSIEILHTYLRCKQIIKKPTLCPDTLHCTHVLFAAWQQRRGLGFQRSQFISLGHKVCFYYVGERGRIRIP